MPTLTRTSDSSAARPLPLRMRSDLIVAPQRIAGRRYWAVKDPVAMAYFRLRDEEHAVLEMLDGQASSAEIIARFERRFAPRRLDPAGLQGFLAKLHSDGLVISDAAGKGINCSIAATRPAGAAKRPAWPTCWRFAFRG